MTVLCIFSRDLMNPMRPTGMLVITVIDYELEDTDYMMVIGSFGATAVLVYSAWQAPLAQPRNVIFGHVLSALVGVSISYVMLL